MTTMTFPPTIGTSFTIDTITVNGDDRAYTYLPPEPTTQDPVPLVIALHGGGGNIQKIAAQLGFIAAPHQPFGTIFPQGYGPSDTIGVWNSGHSVNGLRHGKNDVAFIDALITEAENRAATAGCQIDAARVYAIGFSNGGMMAYRLAAELSHRLAGIATICSSIGGDPDPNDPTVPIHINDPGQNNADPMAITHYHGLADEGVPFYGGPTGNEPLSRSEVPAWDAVHLWVQHNRCSPIPEIATHPYGIARTWRGGTNGAEVRLITSPGLGHQVPDNAIDELIIPLLQHSK